MLPTMVCRCYANAMVLRQCLIEPVPALFEAAAMLSSAVDAHLAGDTDEADRLLRLAHSEEVRAFTEGAWGTGAKERFGFITVPGAPPALSLPDRPAPRMPTIETRQAVIQRDGYHCRFCGLP